MAKTPMPKKKTPPPPPCDIGIQLATPEHSVPSDYPASMGESRVARLERKLDEALEKLADAQERLRRIDRRSRHLD